MQLTIVFLCILLKGYVKAQFRIVEGDDTTIEQFPFVAIISKKMGDSTNFKPSAGGVIVGPRSILTAAHVCVVGVEYLYNFEVHVGSTLYNTGGVTIDVQNYTLHPKYNGLTGNYDYCMMQLKEKVIFDKTKQPAVLPDPKDKLENGDEVVAVGWGETLDEEYPLILKKVTLQKISNEKCQKDYPDDQITENNWCAKVDGSIKKTFKGDSGGPVISKKDNKLYGIVSWGTPSSTEIAADVYSSVQSELNWIKSFIV